MIFYGPIYKKTEIQRTQTHTDILLNIVFLEVILTEFDNPTQKSIF